MESLSTYRTAEDLVAGWRHEPVSGQPSPTETIRSAPAAHLEAVLIVGAGTADRNGAALARVQEFWRRYPAAVVWRDRAPDAWPFEQQVVIEGSPDEPCVLVVTDIGQAFPNAQTNATRLVSTQSTYTVQKRLDALERRPAALIVATANEVELRAGADEAFSGRGPWARFSVLRVSGEAERPGLARVPEGPADGEGAAAWLQFGYRNASPALRVESCRRATALDDASAVAHLALGSACMEQEDFEDARQALDRAAALAPEWEAIYFERGKFWMRYEDMGRASADFARACERMPTFAASFSNLGATLGELDRQEEAVAAFTQALKHDPYGFPVLNNIGVVCRELGRLEESERAFRKVIEIAPDFVFGHYNLGHTLFLNGRFGEAVSAYEAGQARDAQRNARQASRLALARLAAGNPDGARRDFEACLATVPPESRGDLLAEAREILAVLLALQPDLVGAQAIAARIARELASGG